MTELKTQALAKMNDEMSKPHSAPLDQIHNWLCEQDDEDLFKGITVKEKTLNTALNYVSNIASKTQTNRCTVMTDQEVYDHIVFYFKNEIKEVAPVAVKVQTSEVKKYVPPVITHVEKPTPAPKKVKVSMEMSIFDFLDEPAPVKDPAEFDPSDESMREMNNQPEPEIDSKIETQAELIQQLKEEAKANAWEDEVNEGDGEVEVSEDDESEPID
jgi:hypothetical protein